VPSHLAESEQGWSEQGLNYEVVDHFVAFGSEVAAISAFEAVLGLTKLSFFRCHTFDCHGASGYCWGGFICIIVKA
jgi:hypothetical protein